MYMYPQSRATYYGDLHAMMQDDRQTARQARRKSERTPPLIITTSRDNEATRWCGWNTRGRSGLRWTGIKMHIYMPCTEGQWRRRPSHIQSNGPPFACHFSITTFSVRPRHFYFQGQAAGGEAAAENKRDAVHAKLCVDILGTYGVSGSGGYNENRVKRLFVVVGR